MNHIQLNHLFRKNILEIWILFFFLSAASSFSVDLRV